MLVLNGFGMNFIFDGDSSRVGTELYKKCTPKSLPPRSVMAKPAKLVCISSILNKT
jgi:hypothetical protein